MQRREGNKLKGTFDMKTDEQYLCFSRMGGAGIIMCRDCGYEEEIISFTHGMMSCEIGRQMFALYSMFQKLNQKKILSAQNVVPLLGEKRNLYSKETMIRLFVLSVRVFDWTIT